MEWMLNIDIKPLPEPIGYEDSILLTGSCFTEHIGNALSEAKMEILQNPNGILFNPESICNSLISYIENEPATAADLFSREDVWHHWQYHSRFSGLSPEEVIREINHSRAAAHQAVMKGNWLIITIGSAFSYRLGSQALEAGAGGNLNLGAGVANCHRAPAGWFRKEMLSIDDIVTGFDNTLHRLWYHNPGLRVLFTVSPVRHARDGVVENSRSKARIIEAVHHLVNKFDRLYYFPAYELVIDVLRDYRFFDIDLIHPNYAATQFVLEHFVSKCIRPDQQALMQELKKLAIARRHRPLQPHSKSHQQFLVSQLEKTRQLQQQYSFLNLEEELRYFSAGA